MEIKINLSYETQLFIAYWKICSLKYIFIYSIH